MPSFPALRVYENPDGSFSRRWESRHTDELPQGEVLIRLEATALNYKDALSATGNKGVSRHYPHTPGIDGAGVVAESLDPRFKAGDEVLVTGFDLGMNTDGGFAQYIRVPADWVVHRPTNLDAVASMTLGTAALTAAIGLYKMEQIGQKPSQGPILVTGASGGVGSLAVALFAKAGYTVIASSGKTAAKEYLHQLGASEVVDRAFADDDSGRPLLRPKWAGAFDTVGGNTLATALKACQREGSVAACGLVASANLATSVFPFILNGVNLLGVESATYPMTIRQHLWEQLAGAWRIDHLDSIRVDCGLEELDTYIEPILAGNTQGRVVARIE